MTKVLLLPVLCLPLVACLSNPTTPEQVVHAERTTPTCMTSRECELKWAAAKRWVIDNSAYKIRLISADYIETYSATGGSPSISVRVSKEPLATGGYKIKAEVWCDNMFGCVPNATESVIHFNREVAATPY